MRLKKDMLSRGQVQNKKISYHSQAKFKGESAIKAENQEKNHGRGGALGAPAGRGPCPGLSSCKTNMDIQ